ncbi:hypothetical protein MUK42_05600 [Musa troglodytarum]|uniref:BZIP domain-containing protein n=1 Tax=Musa troglodytarum TaxID=320322 RepID=A0A9E7JGY5_9LILI|nr:hypothetical protein MUK42_05600 [Musa troglodytarum]
MPSKSLIPPPTNPNPNLPRPNAPVVPPSMCGGGDLDPAPHFGGPHHRRAHSELAFRISEDLHLGPASEDDVFRTYMDVEKIGSGMEDGEAPASEAAGRSGPRDRLAVDCLSGNEGNAAARPKHRHSNSVDASGSGGDGAFGEVMEAKKAMPPEKLAELAVIDPKRAKRILANRQSAARSKQRKANYIVELERKVQTLQTEATTLSAQLTLFQKDISELATENAGLKIWLQSMEQQAQLNDESFLGWASCWKINSILGDMQRWHTQMNRDAYKFLRSFMSAVIDTHPYLFTIKVKVAWDPGVSDGLKQEVERLKIATGEKVERSEAYNLGLMNLPFLPFVTPSQEQPRNHQRGFELQAQIQQSQLDDNGLPSNMMQQGHLMALPGVDIRKGSEILNPDNSVTASEGSCNS